MKLQILNIRLVMEMANLLLESFRESPKTCVTNSRSAVGLFQSYEIKSPPWTIWWFRILGIFSVENIDRLGAMMFQTSDNSQLCIDSQYSSQQLTIVWSLIHHTTQPILIFSRVRVLHLDRLNPKGGGGGSKCPIGQEIRSHFPQDHAMVTKILDFIHKHPN